MDDIELDLIDTSTLKIVVMWTIVAEPYIYGGAKLTIRIHPDASIGHLQTKVRHFPAASNYANDVKISLNLLLLRCLKSCDLPLRLKFSPPASLSYRRTEITFTTRK